MTTETHLAAVRCHWRRQTASSLATSSWLGIVVVFSQLRATGRFTGPSAGRRLDFQAKVNGLKTLLGTLRWSAALAGLLLTPALHSSGQAKSGTAQAKPPGNPAQIELLETKYRFEANGDSRKEVHLRVRINNELGVQQFARLKFDYDRSCQSVEIPLTRITHPGGGTAEILPSAISDNPDPAVVEFAAFQNLREKSVRILGLGPGDVLEYRVLTTTTHPPLAPDFWLEHSFDRTGVVSEEEFELDLPSLSNLRVRINPETPPDSPAEGSVQQTGRKIYSWHRKQSAESEKQSESEAAEPDVAISTFVSWNDLAEKLGALLIPTEPQVQSLRERAGTLSSPAASAETRASDIYNFVSKRISTVDLPPGATGFRVRSPAEILESGYGSQEEKFLLFAALANNFFGPARAGLVSTSTKAPEKDLPNPDVFDHVLTLSGYPSTSFWMDLNVEVAPFRAVPMQLRDKRAFLVGPAVQSRWETVIAPFPFPARQKVEVQAEIDSQGKLTAKVSYVMRGDNELLLRVAFHQTPREKWKGVAQLLALSDGFRGQVTEANASDPYDTKDPFSVEYEVTQPKFVNWEKKPVRVPAILPLLGLPDPPAAGSNAPIDLGTPLDVELHCALKIPAGTTARAPTGTAVARDYAEFSSNYSAQAETITATRKIRFLLRKLPGERAMDYNAFLHSVQNDQAQEFVLERHEAPSETAPAQHGH